MINTNYAAPWNVYIFNGSSVTNPEIGNPADTEATSLTTAGNYSIATSMIDGEHVWPSGANLQTGSGFSQPPYSVGGALGISANPAPPTNSGWQTSGPSQVTVHVAPVGLSTATVLYEFLKDPSGSPSNPLKCDGSDTMGSGAAQLLTDGQTVNLSGDGDYYIFACATDWGNEPAINAGVQGVTPNNVTPMFHYQIDSQAPTLTAVVPPSSNGWYNGNIQSGNVLQPQLTINDNMSGAQTAYITWYPWGQTPPTAAQIMASPSDSHPFTAPSPAGPSTQTWNATPPTTDGTWGYAAVATDFAGNVSNVVTGGPFKLDATVPTICYQITDPRTGSFCTVCSTSKTNPCALSYAHPETVTVTATDSGSGMVNLTATNSPDGAAGIITAAPWSWTTPLASGQNILTSTATDTAGNQTSPFSLTFQDDLSAYAPTNFSGVATSPSMIVYTWDAPPTAVDHYQIRWSGTLPDPSNPSSTVSDPPLVDPVTPTKNSDGSLSYALNFQSNRYTTQQWTPNFATNVSLYACFSPVSVDSSCANSAPAGPVAVYTLAQAPAPVSPTAQDDAKAGTPEIAWNPQQNPPSVSYTVELHSPDYNTEMLVSSPTNTTSGSGIMTMPLLNRYGNEPFTGTVIHAHNSDSKDAPASSASAWDFTTLPVAPAAPTPVSAGATSVVGDFAFGLDAVGTVYQLEAIPVDDSNAADILASPQIVENPLPGPNPNPSGDDVAQPPINIPAAQRTITGLTPGTPYWLYVRVKSILDGPSGNFDVLSATSAFTTSLNGGVIIAASSSSLTGSWSYNPPASITAFAAGATDYAQPTPVYSAPVANSGGSPVIVTVGGLTSNTTYSVFLADDSSGQPNLIAGSWALGITSAAVPSPNVSIGGTAGNLNLNVALQNDGNDPNSQYAIQIVPPSGSAYYLSGSGATADHGGSATPVFQTRAAWNSGSNNEVAGLTAVSSTYTVVVSVQQNQLNPTTPIPVVVDTVTIVTPGTVLLTGYGAASGALAIDGVDFDVPVSTAFQLTFNSAMDFSQVQSQIKVTMRTGSPGSFLYTTAVPVLFSSSTLNNQTTVNLMPADTSGAASLWQSNSVYEVIVPAGLRDLYGYTLKSAPAPIQFMTVASGATPVISPLDASGFVTVNSDPGTLSANSIGAIVPRIHFSAPAHAITAPGVSVATPFGSNTIMAAATTAEVLFYQPEANNPVVSQPIGPISGSMSLKLCPQVSFKGVDPTTIGIYNQIPGRSANKISSQPPDAQGCVTTSISQSGLYILAALEQTQLSAAYAYPVPFKPSAGDTKITFKNLAQDATVKIYTITGELVKTLQYGNDGSQALVWQPVSNDSGESVASGVYIYQVKNAWSEKRGKLVIIR